MIEIEGMCCCGVREISGICGIKSKEVIKDFCEIVYGGYSEDPRLDFSFVIFTDINRQSYGDNLTKFIKKFKLGEVISTKSKLNPNSGNMLKVYVWWVNDKNLREWWGEQ